MEINSPTWGTASTPRAGRLPARSTLGSRRRPQGPSASCILRPLPRIARPAGPRSTPHPGCAAAVTSPSTSTSASSASMTAPDAGVLARSREKRAVGGGARGGGLGAGLVVWRTSGEKPWREKPRGRAKAASPRIEWVISLLPRITWDYSQQIAFHSGEKPCFVNCACGSHCLWVSFTHTHSRLPAPPATVNY